MPSIVVRMEVAWTSVGAAMKDWSVRLPSRRDELEFARGDLHGREAARARAAAFDAFADLRYGRN